VPSVSHLAPTHLGLDVHKDTISVAVLAPDRDGLDVERIAHDEASVPVPAGWDARPCAYLLFGPPYDEVAAEARGRGWIVEQLPGRHLHQLVDPDAVARSLLAIADQLGVTKP
jgi:hypothetical protein